MATAKNPDYVQTRAPQVQPNTDAAAIVKWIDRELRALSAGRLDMTAVELRPISAPPPQPREGMIAHADGVHWNPGFGHGPYTFTAGTWQTMLGGGGGGFSGILGVNQGGTGADLSTTGGPHQVLMQTALGANFTVGQLNAADISGLGTAAVQNVGTGPGNVVELDPSGKLPAVDGSQLVNLPSVATVLGAGPGGRLTLTPNTPVMNASSASMLSVFYTPYIHQFVPIFNGSVFAMTDIGGQLVQVTTDASKSPAAAAPSSNYDMFVWLDVGNIARCTRGPPWISDTTRGTGAGTSQISQVNGIYTNTVAIVNGPAAGRGTYVGTIRTNSSARVDFVLGAVGTPASFGIWNMYNRVPVSTMAGESTVSWTYASNVYRAMNGTGFIRSSFIRGLDEDCMHATLNAMMQDFAGINNIYTRFNIGLDALTPAVNNTQGLAWSNGTSGFVDCVVSTWAGFPGLGYHFLQALESGDNVHANTIYGSPYSGLTTDLRL